MNYCHHLVVIMCHHKPIQMDKAVTTEMIQYIDAYYTLLSLKAASVLTLTSQNCPVNESTQTHR